MQVLTNISTKINKSKSGGRAGQEGMTLIEVVIAMIILSTGLIAVAAAVIYALQLSINSRNITEGKLLASAMLEHIETLRNTNQLKFKQIANPATVENDPPPTLQFEGFSDAFIPIYSLPGPDGVLGTSDDDETPEDAAQSKFRRKVVITLAPRPAPQPPDPNLKIITVTVEYPGVQGKVQELSMTAYLANQNNN